MYLGPSVPTSKEFKRTPMLVRRHKVAAALEWLKLNHVDYADLEISYRNLEKYPENEPPVIVHFSKTSLEESTMEPESTGVHHVEEEEGVEDGQCPFVVHGLTGTTLEWLGKKTPYEIRARAVDHFVNGGKVLGIGHAEKPESLYNNPRLYPQMFPWLFPYGMGWLNNHDGSTRMRVSEERRMLKWLFSLFSFIYF